ncbi:endocuticle structural glycoprotein ABD-4-like isoform X2 [Nilaparvata lugens]|uniref:endocuticle structural glycoprotein ABD-4-like isoform X1 n=1 Tax=Nilaparvata lugens TaxID=108931 RepID=UPI00193D9A68|nr:endocuticle structural glycoprotein ABD-4-like isoform X1 [Nilaparvata lugens]XP_039294334.1 endocuticle structural glycoprotein ABD-4-like isoform X2 [Nilaparvata lugens]
MKFLITLVSALCAVAFVSAAPQFRGNQPQPQQPQSSPVIAIVRQAQDGPNYDGRFNYQYETENGIQTSASGDLKNAGTPDEALVIQGSYSYTAPDGTPIQVTYVADETGFHAEGAHLPTPPPIPEAIAKSLEYLRSLPPSKEDAQQPFRKRFARRARKYRLL